MLYDLILQLFLFSIIITSTFYICYYIILNFFNNRYKDNKNDIEYYYPNITLIIPVYNEEKIIQKKIFNIMESKYHINKMETIFVDGSSTDNTPQLILNNIIEYNNNFKLIKQNIRYGYNNAIFEGIKNSKGEIIVFTDAAAFFFPNTLNELVKKFSNNIIGAVTGKEIVLSKNIHDIGPKLEKTYRKVYDFMRKSETAIDSTLDAKGEILAVRRNICMKLIDHIGMSTTASFDCCVPYQTKKEGYRTVFAPEAQYIEYAPATFNDRMKQQIRRGSILIASMLMFKHMIFKRKYDKFSSLIMPAHFIMLVILPWFFLLASFSLVMLITFNKKWIILLIILVIPFLIEKYRIFMISFIQSQIALIIANMRILTKEDNQKIETITSTRN